MSERTDTITVTLLGGPRDGARTVLAGWQREIDVSRAEPMRWFPTDDVAPSGPLSIIRGAYRLTAPAWSAVSGRGAMVWMGWRA